MALEFPFEVGLWEISRENNIEKEQIRRVDRGSLMAYHTDRIGIRQYFWKQTYPCDEESKMITVVRSESDIRDRSLEKGGEQALVFMDECLRIVYDGSKFKSN